MVTQTGLNQHGLEPKLDTEPLNPTSVAMSPASWANAAESPGAGRERSGKKKKWTITTNEEKCTTTTAEETPEPTIQSNNATNKLQNDLEI